MNIAVWGAGNVGTHLVRRLAVTPYASKIAWLNRTSMEKPAVDIAHGLAFAPTCRHVHHCLQNEAQEVLPEIDVLILTLGSPVGKEETRADVYTRNVQIYRDHVIPAVRDSFKGVALVITNPVDLMARLLWRETKRPESTVFGLGTVVETARLKASLGSFLARPAREVFAYAIGTHDPDFVPVVCQPPAIGDKTDKEELAFLGECAQSEAAKAAQRVKTDTGSSVHPIVEGALAVIEAIAGDARSVLTVSVPDFETDDDLFYSVPCEIGSDGIVQRFPPKLDAESANKLEQCKQSLRNKLRAAREC